MNLKNKKPILMMLIILFFYEKGVSQNNDYIISSFESNTKDSEIAPCFYQDGILFSSNRSVRKEIVRKDAKTKELFYDIFYEKKNRLRPISLLNKVNSIYHNCSLSFNQKGDIVYYSKTMKDNHFKQKMKSFNLGIYSLVLNESGEWEKSEAFKYNDIAYSVTDPFISKDGNTLYFSSNMPGGYGGMDLYKVTSVSGVFGKPINLGNIINTSGNEISPYMDDNNNFYFSSDSHTGMGGFDIFMSKENWKGYNPPKNMGVPINSLKDDFGYIIRKNKVLNKNEGYFVSNRTENESDNIYYWLSNEQQLFGRGRLFEKETLQPRKNVELIFKDKNNKEERVVTNSKGEYEIPLQRNTEYTISAVIKNHIDYKESLLTNVPIKENTIIKDLLIEKDPYLFLKITDSKTNVPLKGVQVIFVDTKTRKEIKMFPDSNGTISSTLFKRYKINDELDITINIKKEGYLSKSTNLKMKIIKGGKIELKEDLLRNISSLVKKEIGLDLSKEYKLNPIYYDYESFEILPKSAIELDKIVSILRSNPGLRINLRSHTDSRGKNSYNLELSDKRAKSAANYIEEKLNKKGKVEAKGYGENQLLNRCKNNIECSEEEHALNRRTEFIIIK